VRCPYCSEATNRVIDSRLGRDGSEIRRRRECLECSRRFTTRERVEEVVPKVVKRDGRREEFLRSKLLSATQKACQKRPVSADDLEKLVDRVERGVADLGQKEVPTALIGERMLDELTALDPLAAARFASVFRDFRSAEDYEAFFASLAALGSNPGPPSRAR
jgi:transcriptional repressor NrdR